MAYFPELSPYQYGLRRPIPGILHVGWLDDLHSFSRGAVGEDVVAKLKELRKKPVNSLFGFHVCQICCPRSLAKHSKEYIEVVTDARCNGNGEIRIKLDGITYAAPVLIIHYIEEHGYLPPEDFLDAVLTGTPVTQEEFYPNWRRKSNTDDPSPAPVYPELDKADMDALLLAKEESMLKPGADESRVKAEQPLPYPGKLLGMTCGFMVAPGALVFAWLLSSYKRHGYERMARELKVWFCFGLAAWPVVIMACLLLAN